MKSYYKVIVSDIKKGTVRFLPFTLKTKFRSVNSAFRVAGVYHKEGCDVVVCELNNEGMVATLRWVLPLNLRMSVKMENPSYLEIAQNWALWKEYVDPSGIGTEEEFDAMTLAERIAFQEVCFGREED